MNWKRLTTIAALLLGIVAIAGLGIGRLFLDHWHRYEPVGEHPTGIFVDLIERQGFTPEVATSLRSMPLPPRIKYLYIAESTGAMRILAANPAALEGRSHADLEQALQTARLEGESADVRSPDGSAYRVVSARQGPTLPGQIGAPAFLVGLLAAALAWLCLAAWIYLDARERGHGSAQGWALLGVLAAPLALAVWLINRPAPQAEAQPICPGCGADTTKDGAFCVRCGYALQPTCPDCKRPVAADWTYCAACGNNLVE